MEDQPIDKLFAFHKLNEQGQKRAKILAGEFHGLLYSVWDNAGRPENREWSIAKTKLEEAAFYAKKAMAVQSENQE